MIIQLNDDETRLLYNVLIEQAQEHFSYASTSEVAQRFCKLAIRFGRPVRELPKSLADPSIEGDLIAI